MPPDLRSRQPNITPDNHPGFCGEFFGHMTIFFAHHFIYTDFSNNPPFLIRTNDTLHHIPNRDLSIKSVLPVTFPSCDLETLDVCLEQHTNNIEVDC